VWLWTVDDAMHCGAPIDREAIDSVCKPVSLFVPALSASTRHSWPTRGGLRVGISAAAASWLASERNAGSAVCSAPTTTLLPLLPLRPSKGCRVPSSPPNRRPWPNAHCKRGTFAWHTTAAHAQRPRRRLEKKRDATLAMSPVLRLCPGWAMLRWDARSAARPCCRCRLRRCNLRRLLGATAFGP
jgi:hypothetical protein